MARDQRRSTLLPLSFPSLHCPPKQHKRGSPAHPRLISQHISSKKQLQNAPARIPPLIHPRNGSPVHNTCIRDRGACTFAPELPSLVARWHSDVEALASFHPNDGHNRRYSRLGPRCAQLRRVGTGCDSSCAVWPCSNVAHCFRPPLPSFCGREPGEVCRALPVLVPILDAASIEGTITAYAQSHRSRSRPSPVTRAQYATGKRAHPC
ncbi:hypothetical protein BKA93DRAFT_614977 [Sparassis latifolia]